MISKFVIISIISVIFITVVIIAIYVKQAKTPAKKLCNGIICPDGLKCQADGKTCCKNELWGKNEKNLYTCCESPLCGEFCCDKDHTCGIDKNGRSVCCLGTLCGNKLCCSITGEECQDNNMCCKTELWDKTNKKCCTKPLCKGICCNDNQQCDGEKCIDCDRDLCDGVCCDKDQNQKCQKGQHKYVCCSNPHRVCGDNCCETGTCMPDYSCCEHPCGLKQLDNTMSLTIKNTECCSDPYPNCISDTKNHLCCKSPLTCRDITTNELVCYDETLCGMNPTTGNCECCSGKDQKYISATGKCALLCGDGTTICDLETQECINYNGKYYCMNKDCLWSPIEYKPDIQNGIGFTAESSQVPACYYTDTNNITRDYIVRDPKDPNDLTKILEVKNLHRNISTKQAPDSKVTCNINNCYERLQESGLNYLSFDDTTCSATYDCSKLPSLEDMTSCPTIEASCCKDNLGKFTGQVCPNNRVCYMGTCICHENENPEVNICTVFDRQYTCNNNGDPDFNSPNFNCKCDPKYSGDKCDECQNNNLVYPGCNTCVYRNSRLPNCEPWTPFSYDILTNTLLKLITNFSNIFSNSITSEWQSNTWNSLKTIIDNNRDIIVNINKIIISNVISRSDFESYYYDLYHNDPSIKTPDTHSILYTANIYRYLTSSILSNKQTSFFYDNFISVYACLNNKNITDNVINKYSFLEYVFYIYMSVYDDNIRQLLNNNFDKMCLN